MATHRKSYIKTSATAFATAILVLGLTAWLESILEPLRASILLLGGSLATGALLVGLSGLIVLRRDSDIELGRMDLFAKANRSRSEHGRAAPYRQQGALIARVWRAIVRHDRPIVGELVRVKALADIHKTLDEGGCLDGLPFMREMASYCGQTARVYRAVDKIYDYGGAKDLRRMRDAVLLKGLRCDGSSHDGCQAECYLIWKTAWLTRVGPYASEERWSVDRRPARTVKRALSENADTRYTCQFTQLVKATTPLTKTDPRQDLRPLLDGNVSLPAFSVALLTRLFSAAQRLRGGAGYPFMPTNDRSTTPMAAWRARPGDVVRVRTRQSIAPTLDSWGRNRGLWFDREMLKHCRQKQRVARRIERIIDDVSGKMIHIKTPCLVLEGVQASGEFLRFCPQEELIYWREAWLESEPE